MSDIDTAVVDSLKALDPRRPIREADLSARDLPEFMDGTANVPRIAKQLRVPSFTYSAFDRFAWPRDDGT